MDADTLRLILFVTGVALILGIYFLGRKKRNGTARIHATKRDDVDEVPATDQSLSNKEEEDDGDEELPAEEPVQQDNAWEEQPMPEERVEPHFSAVDDEPADKAEPSLDLFPDPLIQDELLEEPKLEQTSFAFTADDGEEAYESIPAGDDVPVKIIQLILAAKPDHTINGAKLKEVCDELELRHGDMDIYHYYIEANGRRDNVAFSMASMVEPGTFPKKGLDEFETPGVVLFAQLPGPKDGLAIFSDMLFSAERMAALLDLELQDETHSTLSKQSVEHTRVQILEHRRQVQLARSKR
ncbi:MAG: cell division protein ZipA [Chromatiales bacterium]|nr:cell division protein ZipA [Chromatiales bacterium]